MSAQHLSWLSEVCHPRCVFKLYSEVNLVKNTYKFIEPKDISPI